MPRRNIVKHSKGELLCRDILLSHPDIVKVKFQHRIGCYIYDYMFETRDGLKYLLEYDGIQHFQYVPFIHRNERRWKSLKTRDINKMATGLLEFYNFIRIDYRNNTCEKIMSHVCVALTTQHTFYTSDPILYLDITLGTVSASVISKYSMRYNLNFNQFVK